MKYNSYYQRVLQWQHDYLDGMTANEWVEWAKALYSSVKSKSNIGFVSDNNYN